ncbi:MAG: FtsQ-type POTRA domain-containing protein [Cyanobacteria bacterium J06627_28]
MSSTLPNSSDLLSSAPKEAPELTHNATPDAVSASKEVAANDSQAESSTAAGSDGQSSQSNTFAKGALAGISVLPKPPAPKLQALASRRQQLRAQRRGRFYTLAWRTAVVGSLAFGLVWLAKSPIWLIRSADQIEVEDNELLSDDNVRSLLSITYPQSLLEVQPDDLAEQLVDYEPIADAIVSRQLLPPGISVKVIERTPVAVTLPDPATAVQQIPEQPVPFQEPGVIDAQGYWMPYNSYADIGATAQPPTLSVKGMQAGYESAWQTIYRGIAQSPVAITSVDWTRADNVILISELGPVHIGPLGSNGGNGLESNFQAQLIALDQLRGIRDKMTETIAYIDLRDPDNPVIETVPSAEPDTEEANSMF